MSDTTQFAGISPWHQVTWDWRAAGNFIGGGSGAGVLVIGVLTGLSPWLVAVLGCGLIGAGLFCVWLEIGKPLRALNVYRHPATSWMTREALVALVVFGCGFGAAALDSRPLLGAAALAAVGFVGCQARILTGAQGIPAWREPRVVPLILASAAVEGAGLILPLTQPAWLGGLLLGLLGLRFVCWRRYVVRLEAGRAPGRVLVAVRALDRPFGLYGHAVPAVLAVVGIAAPLLLMAAGLLAAAGGWVFKFILITRLAFNQGFAIPATPSRGAGSSGPGVRPGWE